MTMMKKELNPMIKDKLVRPMPLKEMEEVIGGEGLGTMIEKTQKGAKCVLGIHDWDIRFEHKPWDGNWILSRAVKTCKFCFKREYEEWVIK